MNQRQLSSGNHLSLQYPKNLIAHIYQHINVDVFCDILNGKISFTEEQIEELYCSIANLSERQREVLRLRYEEKLTYKEIADLQSISLSACRDAAERAVHKIRKRFAALPELFDSPYSEKWLDSFRVFPPPPSPAGFSYVSIVTGSEYNIGAADG